MAVKLQTLVLGISLIANAFVAFELESKDDKIRQQEIQIGADGVTLDEYAAEENLMSQMGTSGFRINWANCTYKDGFHETTQLCDVSATAGASFSQVDEVAVDQYVNRTFFDGAKLKPSTDIKLHLECSRSGLGRNGACQVRSSQILGNG